MLLGLVQSGQISATVGAHASSEKKSCPPKHWLPPLTNLPTLNLNFFFRSFLRNWRASLPYEMACKHTIKGVLITGKLNYRVPTHQGNFIIAGDFPLR
jgi:hypothetical protein